MREMASRVDSADFAFFVTAVLIQRQTGGDLTRCSITSAPWSAADPASDHVKAITAKPDDRKYSRASRHTVCGFLHPHPGYAGILIREEMGKMLLGASVLFQILSVCYS